MGRSEGYSEAVFRALSDLRPVVPGQRVLHLEPIARNLSVPMGKVQGALQGLRSRHGVRTTTLVAGKIYRVDSFGALFAEGTETGLSVTETPATPPPPVMTRGAVFEAVSRPLSNGALVLQAEDGDLWLAERFTAK